MSSATRQLNAESSELTPSNKCSMSQPSKNGYFVTRRDFRRLHLRIGETDIRLIRSGAERIARARATAAEASLCPNDLAVDLVSDIAVAAYRLMDPRRRTSLSQRVRLCYPLDRNSIEPPKAPVERCDLAQTLTLAASDGANTEVANTVEVGESVVNWVELAKETPTIQQARDLVRTLKAYSLEEANSKATDSEKTYTRVLIDRLKKLVGFMSAL